jgi:hypothetical protein
MDVLKTYLSTISRNKLLFASDEIDGIEFTDIGRLLSDSIASNLLNKHLSMMADDALERIISEHTFHDQKFGDYVAIRNIGILFEPVLHFSLQAKFDSWSRSRLLIVHLEGYIQDKIFFLSNAHDIKYSINLSDITYKIFDNEI